MNDYQTFQRRAWVAGMQKDMARREYRAWMLPRRRAALRATGRLAALIAVILAAFLFAGWMDTQADSIQPSQCKEQQP